jgi:hypothetical protein
MHIRHRHATRTVLLCYNNETTLLRKYYLYNPAIRKVFNTKPPIIVQLKTRSIVILSSHFRPPMGMDSSVCIETRYGLEVLGIESRWRRDFPRPSRPSVGTTQRPIQCIESFSAVERPRRDDHPFPSSVKVKERVELYLYSPFWAVLACYRMNVTTAFTLRHLASTQNVPTIIFVSKVFSPVSACTQCKFVPWRLAGRRNMAVMGF